MRVLAENEYVKVLEVSLAEFISFPDSPIQAGKNGETLVNENKVRSLLEYGADGLRFALNGEASNPLGIDHLGRITSGHTRKVATIEAIERGMVKGSEKIFIFQSKTKDARRIAMARISANTGTNVRQAKEHLAAYENFDYTKKLANPVDEAFKRSGFDVASLMGKQSYQRTCQYLGRLLEEHPQYVDDLANGRPIGVRSLDIYNAKNLSGLKGETKHFAWMNGKAKTNLNPLVDRLASRLKPAVVYMKKISELDRWTKLAKGKHVPTAVADTLIAAALRREINPDGYTRGHVSWSKFEKIGGNRPTKIYDLCQNLNTKTSDSYQHIEEILSGRRKV